MRRVTSLGFVLAAGLTSGAMAATSLDSLQGAWVMQGMQCADTFVRKGDAWAFKDDSTSANTGVIISGSKIDGPGSTCRVEKVSPKKDHLVALLGCADAIMFSNVSVSFRIVDDNTFERFDDDFPEFTIPYTKCPVSQ